jgi:Xaa-Pro aminopeptidase
VRAVPDVVIYADTVRSPELRHEIPLAIGDPFLYVERNGSRHVVIGALELPRVRTIEGLQVHPLEEFGYDELLRSGKSRAEIRDEVNARACEALGVAAAAVPGDFPLEIADSLRGRGLDVAADRELFDRRRRVKNEHELAGMRRAQRAAEAGMDAARELFRRGLSLTVEEVKAAIEARFVAADCTADEFIVSHGPQSAIGHHGGEGTIAEGEPIVIDLWPRDRESGCYADMTRTFVIGDPSDELREWHRLCKDALDRALGEIRAGVTGKSVYDGTCDIFEAAGYKTQRTKEQGVPLEEGFFHSLGHGVGLEVHEEPSLGMLGQELVAGDVVSVEPGLYKPGVGGCRLEDLVVVTEGGCENLTDSPYDLKP